MNKSKAFAVSRPSGFTIVELLIVVVVIAILAAISLVAYTGIQNRAANAKTESEVAAIAKALEMYHADKGMYPNGSNYTPGSTAINGAWSTTADGSWQNLLTVLSPYAQNLPTRSDSSSAMGGGDSFDYYGNQANSCGASLGQMYIIVYRLRGAQKNTTKGTCNAPTVGPYSASNYIIIK